MLTNTEIWYNLQKNEVDQLEEIFRMLIRGILEVPSSSCIESLYLELGLIPIHIIIKARRVNYLHYLATLKENEMLSKVFKSQWNYPVKDDWTLEVKKNLEELETDLSLEEINNQDSHKKMENLHYTDLKLQNYLKDSKIPVAEAKNLFRFRTRVAKFKENMKNSYLSSACPLCFVQPDTQQHSVECVVVKTNIQIEGDYKDIFSENIPSNISKTLLKISEFRKDLF